MHLSKKKKVLIKMKTLTFDLKLSIVFGSD